MSERAQLEEDLEQRLGETIGGKYRLDSLLGVGGMGAVYQAHHLLLKRDVAVKVLHPELTANEDVSKRFDREAQSAARLEHPNIIHVTDYGSTSDGTKFMVMQLLEGEELVALLEDKGGLDPERACDLMLQILAGLEHAHQHGVIHRDLKPENIFVTTDHEGQEVLKIVDFGIAKMVGPQDGGDGEPLTRLGIVFGTPQYMSPEQATGVPIDARTDIYSAGLIFYEMLAGRPAFDADDPVALVRMQVSTEPPPLEPSPPPAIAEILGRMVHKERDERFASSTRARAAIEEVLEGLRSGTIAATAELTPAGAVTKPIPATGSISEPIQLAGAAVAEAISQPRRSFVPFVGGIVFVLLGLGVFTWLWADDDDEASASADTEGLAELDEGAAAADRPVIPEALLSEIDRLLLAKDADGALEKLGPLRAAYPNDAILLWREGRALAMKNGKRGEALVRYGEAVDHRPALLDDREFWAELYELLQIRGLRDEATEIALAKLGTHGHKFLLELVNEQEPKRALRYDQRHRVLDELASDPENAPLIDQRLNLARDLWQARQSERSCELFAYALASVDAQPDAYFVAPLQRAKAPHGYAADDDDRSVCEKVDPVLLATRVKFQVYFDADQSGALETAEGAAGPAGKPVREGEGASAPPPQPKKGSGDGGKGGGKGGGKKKKKKKNEPWKELGKVFGG